MRRAHSNGELIEIPTLTFGGHSTALLMENVPGGDLERAPETTAVFASSDELALELFEAARQRNTRVPRDLSIVGFDDIPDAPRADPPLTTLVQPTVEKGRVASRMIFEVGPPIHVILPVQLVVRGSTAAPRS